MIENISKGFITVIGETASEEEQSNVSKYVLLKAKLIHSQQQLEIVREEFRELRAELQDVIHSKQKFGVLE